MNAIVNFDLFTSIPILFYKTIGVSPYQLSNSDSKTYFGWIPWTIFVLSFLNLGLCVLGEMVYFVKQFGNFNNFIEETNLTLCIGFILLSFAKVAAITWKRDQMNRLMTEMELIFPKTRQQQNAYHVDEYAAETLRLMKIYTWIQMVMIWLFNLYPVSDTIIGYITHRTWKVDFPYIIWYPFNPYAPGWFELNYLSQIWAAYVAASAILATDLLLCGIVMQICMHFHHLRATLERLQPTATNANTEWEKLRQCIKTHNRIMRYVVLYTFVTVGQSIFAAFLNNIQFLWKFSFAFCKLNRVFFFY